MGPITVAVADAERLFAEALTFALREHADLDVSDACSTTGRAIVSEAVRRPPDVALIDFWIADMAGPAAARGVRKVSPSTRVLFLTEFFIGPVQLEDAQRAGALWFLRKTLGLEEVVEAIRAAAATPAPPATESGQQTPERVGRLLTLTAREIEVLQVLRKGVSLRDAADELSISTGTVKNHIHKILVKTNVRNQVEAMIMAEDEGFISCP